MGEGHKNISPMKKTEEKKRKSSGCVNRQEGQEMREEGEQDKMWLEKAQWVWCLWTMGMAKAGTAAWQAPLNLPNK